MNTQFISKVSNNDENVVTEYLYSMMQSKYVRDTILLSLTSSLVPKLNIAELNSIKYDGIRTQNKVEGGGNADLRIESSSCYFLVENKINSTTALQDYQTTTYPREVFNRKNNSKALIFLVPRNYHINQLDLTTRCNRSCNINNENSIALVKTWEDFIIDIENSDIADDNPIVAEFIDYLRTRLRISEVKYFTRKDFILMLNPQYLSDAISFYHKFRKFILKTDTAILKFNSSLKSCDLTGTEDDEKILNIGKYLKTNKENYAFWYGLNMQAYEGNCLFVCLSHKLYCDKIAFIESTNKSYEKIAPDSSYFVPVDDPEWIYVPVSSFFLEVDNLDDNVDHFACEILHTIKKYTGI
jgi:hypothetical protein